MRSHAHPGSIEASSGREGWKLLLWVSKLVEFDIEMSVNHTDLARILEIKENHHTGYRGTQRAMQHE